MLVSRVFQPCEQIIAISCIPALLLNLVTGQPQLSAVVTKFNFRNWGLVVCGFNLGHLAIWDVIGVCCYLLVSQLHSCMS